MQCTDDVVDVPAVSVVQAPLVRVVAETAEMPVGEKIVAIPEVRMVQGTDHETVMRDVVQNTDMAPPLSICAALTAKD